MSISSNSIDPAAVAAVATVTQAIALTTAQKAEVCKILRTVLAKHTMAEPPLQVWVFGSRATGRARPFSDLDLLITEPPSLSWRERADLRDAFEASDLPFRVDVVEAALLAEAMALRVMGERLVLL